MKRLKRGLAKRRAGGEVKPSQVKLIGRKRAVVDVVVAESLVPRLMLIIMCLG